MDNRNNIDGFDNVVNKPVNNVVNNVVNKPVNNGVNNDNDYHPVDQGVDHEEDNLDIGQKPVKLNMDAPASMVESLNMVWGAPIGGDFMLLSNTIEAGIDKIESQLPVLHPRVGGPGNLGEAPTGGAPPLRAPMGAPKGVSDKTLKIVIIYAPWCGYSIKSLDDFKEMEQKLNKRSNGWTITCELYDSDTSEGKDKVKEYEVKGFPAVFVEVNGSRMEGPRKYDEMVTLINSKTGGTLA
jgi:thiol-disulfide isomerase/thioredoxin